MSEQRYTATVWVDSPTATELEPWMAVRKFFDSVPPAVEWAAQHAGTLPGATGSANVWDEREGREIWAMAPKESRP